MPLPSLLVGSLEKASRPGCPVARAQPAHQGSGCPEPGRGSSAGLRGFGKESGRGLAECKLHPELVPGHLQPSGRPRRAKAWAPHGFSSGPVSYGQPQFLATLNWPLAGPLRLSSIPHHPWPTVRRGAHGGSPSGGHPGDHPWCPLGRLDTGLGSRGGAQRGRSWALATAEPAWGQRPGHLQEHKGGSDPSLPFLGGKAAVSQAAGRTWKRCLHCALAHVHTRAHMCTHAQVRAPPCLCSVTQWLLCFSGKIPTAGCWGQHRGGMRWREAILF